jgi:hypothetical protein
MFGLGEIMVSPWKFSRLHPLIWVKLKKSSSFGIANQVVLALAFRLYNMCIKIAMLARS